ncbi:hypothetical protein DITRI_Ditri13aG0046800 [Diplodiscus trichospermus]
MILPWVNGPLKIHLHTPCGLLDVRGGLKFDSNIYRHSVLQLLIWESISSQKTRSKLSFCVQAIKLMKARGTQNLRHDWMLFYVVFDLLGVAGFLNSFLSGVTWG